MKEGGGVGSSNPFRGGGSVQEAPPPPSREGKGKGRGAKVVEW
jgi:hypothetical protein